MFSYSCPAGLCKDRARRQKAPASHLQRGEGPWHVSQRGAICTSTCTAALTWAGCCRVECCTRCLAQGVTATHIIDGRQQHSLLMEMLTDEGTLTCPDAMMH